MFSFFFFTNPATTEIYTLSLHDALPILASVGPGSLSPGCTISIQSFEKRRALDRKSTRLNSSHLGISYAVFCLKKKKERRNRSGTVKLLHRTLRVLQLSPHRVHGLAIRP